MKEIIKKYDNIVVATIILLISIVYICTLETVAYDEIWNFQNIYKMVNGYTLYNDANVIITPIFFIIANLIQRIFGGNILVFRIYGAVIYTLLILTIYNIFKLLKFQKKEAIMYTLLMHMYTYKLLGASANYNVLAMMFVLLGIIQTMKYLGQKKFNVINGIIMFLVLFTKQNIGAYYIIGIILAQIILKVTSTNQKENTQAKQNKVIIDIIIQLTITTILTIIALITMKLCGNLEGFINYCILGIKEFANNNVGLEKNIIIYSAIIAVTLIFVGIIIKINKNNSFIKNTMILLLVTGIILLFVSYPIVNTYHTILSTLVLIILLIYMVHSSILKDFLNNKIINIAIGTTIIISILICSSNYSKNAKYIKLDTNYSNPYYGAILLPETEEKIEKVNNYIKEKNEKVIIFSRRCSNI